MLKMFAKPIDGKTAAADTENAPLVQFFSVLFIVILGLLIYSNVFTASFQYDDDTEIILNRTVHTLSQPEAVWHRNPGRFLTYWSFALNYRFSGLRALDYHLLNILIHIYTSILVYLLAILTFEIPRMKFQPISSQKHLIAFCTSLVFLCHPVQTEAVDFIVQRATLLGALFYIATILLYVKARFTRKIRYYILAFVTALAAMLSKENTYTLPLALLLYELCFLEAYEGQFRKRVFYLAPFFIMLAGIYFVMYHSKIAAGHLEHLTRANTDISRADYLRSQINVIRIYLCTLLVPVHQNFDYDFQITKKVTEPRTLLSLGLLLFILGMAFRSLKNQRLYAFGVFWFFLTLSLESGVIPIRDLIVEHRLYLPMFGFALAVVSSIYQALNNKNKYSTYMIAIILILCFLTYSRNMVWQSGITLWQDVVQKSPAKARGYANLGIAYAKNHNFHDAVLNLKKSIQIDPVNVYAYVFLARAYIEQGKKDLAGESLQNALAIDPKNYLANETLKLLK